LRSITKTRPYSFRSGNKISFRLEKGSDAEILLNYYLERHPRRKGRITYTIDQIFRLAMKERLPEDSKLTTNMKIQFFNSLKAEQGSDRKAMDEVFRRAIEGYMDLYHSGQAPMIFPSRIGEVQKLEQVMESKLPNGTMNESLNGNLKWEKEVITERKIERTRIIISLEDIKRLFPESYRSTLIFGEDQHRFTVRLPYYDREKFLEMLNIVKERDGRYVPQGVESYFSIPKS